MTANRRLSQWLQRTLLGDVSRDRTPEIMERIARFRALSRILPLEETLTVRQALDGFRKMPDPRAGLFFG